MYILGFDIGGPKCAVVTAECNRDGITFLHKKKCDTDHTLSGEEMLNKLIKMADGILTKKPDRIGVSCGGPLDSRRGIVLSPPNLPTWKEVAVTDRLTAHYGVPAYLRNDADACALAEWQFGAGRGTRNMIFLTFGTGLGAGLILDKRLYTGASDMAGEVGHIRLKEDGPIGYGKRGSFEGFCSGGGIAQMGRRYAEKALSEGKAVSFCKDKDALPSVTAKSIADAAHKGNEDAKEIYRECGKHLGAGLSILIDILNPEAIVIGSIFARSEDLLRAEMEKVIRSECLTFSERACRILPAALGDQIGDYAAISITVTEGERKNERIP